MNAASARQELRRAVSDCRERGLFAAAKWAAQLLVALPWDQETSSSGAAAGHAPSTRAAANFYEQDLFDLGRSFFDCKEYRSAAHALDGVPSPRARFLRGYSTYLAGEKAKEEERVERCGGGGAACAAAVCNPELEALEAELREWVDDLDDIKDGFLLYLLGLVLSARADKSEAREVLAASVYAYPCNWSAWQALQAVCPDRDAAEELALPPHFMTRFFDAALCVDTHANAEALAHLQSLAADFPDADFVLSSAASAHYNLQNFEEAEELFLELLSKDPHRVDGMDTFSNILYVREEEGQLSGLAHRLASSDKYRPETCCVIGNYYSLGGQHERAVIYFRRALRLNPHYLSAWTLMGHEYVELKNPPAAIQAYRAAVDVNPHDYRAWYGLGQTYELVNMPYYALYYFRRAVALRPQDARLWNAMGHCYQAEALGLPEAAIRCHMRALQYDREGVAVHQLATLHARLGQRGEAAKYHRLNLERIEGEGASGQDCVEALSFLAAWHREQGELEAAEGYYTRLLDYGAAGKEQAKASLREIRDLLAAHGGGGGSVGGVTPGGGFRGDPPPSSPGSDMVGTSPF